MSDNKSPTPATREAGVIRGLRCQRTGNLCGSDTWGNGQECACVPCQMWLRQEHVESAPVTDAEVRHADNGIYLRNESVRRVLEDFVSRRTPTLRAPEVRRKPTIDELEEILAQEGRNNVEILPSGEIVSRTAAPSDDDASVTFKQGWEAGHRAALEMASPFIRQRAPEVAAMRPLEDRENQYRRICRLIARLDMGDNDVERDLLAEVTNLAANRDDLHDALELLGTVPTPKSTPTGRRPSVEEKA